MKEMTVKESNFGDILYDEERKVHYYRYIGGVVCIEHNQSYSLSAFSDDKKYIKLGKLRINTTPKQVTEYFANITIS